MASVQYIFGQDVQNSYSGRENGFMRCTTTNNNNSLFPFAHRRFIIVGLLHQNYCQNTQLAYCLYNVTRKWPK